VEPGDDGLDDRSGDDDDTGHQIDFHVIVLDEDGRGV